MAALSGFRNAYRGRRVFVTGHTGFKGSWLSLWLLQLGAEVTGYSLDVPTVPSLFEACGLDRRVTHLVGDIRDFPHLSAAITKSKADIVFHLAAQPLVRRSYADPKLTFDTNIGGGVNLLEAVRHSDAVRCVIYATSDKCYENQEWVWAYRENDPLGGADPYAASKACAELVFAAYCRSFFAEGRGSDSKALVSVRAGNVIGGGDWSEDRIIPDCVNALVAKKPAELRYPEAVRPWQHVLECLSGYLWLGALLWHSPREYGSEAWNFGPACPSRSVRELAECFIARWGSGSWRAAPGTDGRRESLQLRLDSSKALNRLKWRTCLQFEDTVRLTAEWYKAYYGGRASESPLACSIRQLSDYTALARSQQLPWAIPTRSSTKGRIHDRRRAGQPA